MVEGTTTNTPRVCGSMYPGEPCQESPWLSTPHQGLHLHRWGGSEVAHNLYYGMRTEVLPPTLRSVVEGTPTSGRGSDMS